MRKIVASIILLLVVILGGTSLYLAEAKNASFQIIDYKKTPQSLEAFFLYFKGKLFPF